MAHFPPVEAHNWYETIRMADDVTLIHEPWIKPFFRCNMWHVRGRDRDLLFDTGLGHFSLRQHVKLVSERPLICVASHTHFDHIGCHHEFPERCAHRAEANILADPRNDWTLADRYATDDMFDRRPEGWDMGRESSAEGIGMWDITTKGFLVRHGIRISSRKVWGMRHEHKRRKRFLSVSQHCLSCVL